MEAQQTPERDAAGLKDQTETEDRISITLTGAAARFARDYLQRNPSAGSHAEAVRRGYSLLALVEGLEYSQHLGVIVPGHSSLTQRIDVPWRTYKEHVQLPIID